MNDTGAKSLIVNGYLPGKLGLSLDAIQPISDAIDAKHCTKEKETSLSLQTRSINNHKLDCTA